MAKIYSRKGVWYGTADDMIGAASLFAAYRATKEGGE